MKAAGLFRFILVLISTILICYLGLLCYRLLSGPEENNLSYTDNNLQVLDLRIPSKLEFCGEVIPRDDYRIRTALAKEFLHSDYWKHNSHILFNKAQRWFPYIEPILKEQGVPEDFKYLAVIESHLSNVSSKAGAAGFWQLMVSSAQHYGLIVNATVDERLHVEKSTRAACALIREAYAVFGNWTLSAAAYNRGINGMLRAMKEQNTKNYHHLLLNPETGSFVYRILAYKTVLSSPSHFGIKRKFIRKGATISYKTVRIDSSVQDLRSLAVYLKTEYTTLKAHNPWLTSNSLDNPERKLFEIRLPRNSKTDYSAYLLDLVPATKMVSDTLKSVTDTLAQIQYQIEPGTDSTIKTSDPSKKQGRHEENLQKKSKMP
ncbi:MAG TPA: lytic transglycosylase domain-containing protein [Bacteroidia bacterium]|nr:lytic transglycosylase domain-containing protein [Bacteroidia bacterium]